jgi:hypothetical protein
MASWKDRLAVTAQRNRQEIVRANLGRRDMIRMGLMTAGGTLVVKQGLSSRAFADSGSPSSPPIQNPFIQEMPRLPVLNGVYQSQSVRQGRPTHRDHRDRRCDEDTSATAVHDVSADEVL